MFDRSQRDGDTYSRPDFTFDRDSDECVCPAGKLLSTKGPLVSDGTTLLCRASKYDCDACPLKPKCCPKDRRARSRAAS